MCLCLSISDVCWVEIERSFKIKIVNELMEVSCEEVTKGIQVLRGRSALPPPDIHIFTVILGRSGAKCFPFLCMIANCLFSLQGNPGTCHGGQQRGCLDPSIGRH